MMEDNKKYLVIRKVCTLIFALLFFVSLYMSINAFASANPFKIISAAINEKSNDTEGDIISFNDAEVINNVIFHKLNDYVVYKLEIQNNLNKKITILSIKDDNKDTNVEYQYDKHENDKISPNGRFNFLVKALYKNELTDITKRKKTNDLKFTINYLEDDEEKTSSISINPQTRDNIHISYIMLIFSSVGLTTCILLDRKKSKSKLSNNSLLLIIGIILSPIVVNAATYAYNITYKSVTEIKDKLLITIKDGNNTRTEIINYNSKLTLEDGEKEGYDFRGWKIDDNTYFDSSTNIKDDITLTADYTKKSHKITLDANGGSILKDYILVEYESQIGEIPMPTAPTGKKFDGWYTGLTNGEKIESNYVPISNETLYARYSDLVLTVSFNTNEGSNIIDQTVTYGQKATRPSIDPSKVDHVFTNWYTDDTYQTLFDFNTQITSDTIIYANYYHICRTFSTDSWDTIKTNLERDPSYYAIGCQKEVEMDMDNDNIKESYTVRLANTSTAEVCDLDGYSQTSCGLVIEFADIVTTHSMNPTQTNAGGWKNSEMITWLNSDFYNKLPNDLKSVIIPTFPIVSGAGENSTSPDVEGDDININKIYLLSVREAGFNFTVIDSKSDVNTDTKPLDYYSSYDMIKTNKFYKDSTYSYWWLRTADNDSYGLFAYVFGNDFVSIAAGYGSNYAQESLGVAPAFRIGTLSDYTVSFETDGGTSIIDQIVTYGEKATRPSIEPVKVGMEFDNWYTDDTYQTVFDFSNRIITRDTKIYAHYVLPDYCRNFSTQSWSTIASNIKNNSSYYPLGCEKEVTIDMDDDGQDEYYIVRISNTSKPEICNTDGYSQTACGTVFEFTNIVEFHQMNSTNTNEGGWKSTEMSMWLNNDFYNKLPNDLKNVIIPTYPIVSGAGLNNDSFDITNLDSNNKIYLLAAKEVGIDSEYDSKNNYTRVLDYYTEYYNNNGYYDRNKQDIYGNNDYWWLRSAVSNESESFFIADDSGYDSYDLADTEYGVSPAFKIGIN